MSNFFNHIRDTFIAGLFLLLPITVIMILLLRIFRVIRPAIEKLSDALGVHGLSGVRVMVVVALALLCLLAGLLVRMERVGRIREWLERNVLRLIPGYEYIRMRMAQSLGKDSDATDSSILARIDDGWSPGMLVERAADGRCVVYMPDVPHCNSGAVYIVEADQVKFLHVRYGKLNDCIRNYGKGLIALETGSKG